VGEDIVTGGEIIGGEVFLLLSLSLKTHTEEIMLQIIGTVRIADMQAEDTHLAVVTRRTGIIVVVTVLPEDIHQTQIDTPPLEEDNL